jgi:hypothetical protein
MQHQFSQTTFLRRVSMQYRTSSISTSFVGFLIVIASIFSIICPMSSQAFPVIIGQATPIVALPSGETHISFNTLNTQNLTAAYIDGGTRVYGKVTSTVANVTTGVIEISVVFPPQLTSTTGRIFMQSTVATGNSFFLITLPVASPTPSITQMSITATSPTVQSFPLSIQGANFFGTTATMAILNSAGVTVSSIALPIISSSGTVLNVQVPAGAVQTSGQVTIIVANIGGNIASTTLTIGATTTSSTAIPTVGEWSMIVLTLSLFCVVVMYVRRPVFVNVGQTQGLPVQEPIENMKQNMMLGKENFAFHGRLFFPLSFIVTACVWSACVYFHETAVRDMIGTGLTGIVGGYLLQLLALWWTKEK